MIKINEKHDVSSRGSNLNVGANRYAFAKVLD